MLSSSPWSLQTLSCALNFVIRHNVASDQQICGTAEQQWLKRTVLSPGDCNINLRRYCQRTSIRGGRAPVR